MKLKIVTTIAALLPLCLFSQAVDLRLDWNGPPGWQTNGAVFNIRHLAAGSVMNDYMTWPVKIVLTNSLSHMLYNVNQSQFYAISFTNIFTGVESTQGIPPIRAYYNWHTNVSTLVSTRAKREYRGWRLLNTNKTTKGP